MKIKKFFKKLTFVFVLCMMLFACRAVAFAFETASGTSGGIDWSYDADTTTLTISSATNPEEGYASGVMKDYETATTDYPWASYYNTITNLIIKSGVTHIGSAAFNEMTALDDEVILPDSVTSVGINAFRKSGIKGLDLNSVTCLSQGTAALASDLTWVKMENVTMITGDHNFRACKKLGTVAASKLKSIGGRYNFYDCEGLTSVVFPVLTDIGYATFNEAHAIALVFPKQFKSIDPFALAIRGIMYVSTVDDVILLADAHTYAIGGIVAVTDGGNFTENTEFTAGTLATPIKDGYIFGGWYDNAECNGEAVTTPEVGNTYYAKWIELKADDITIECGSTSSDFPTIDGVTLSDWQSDDSTVVSIENNQLQARNVGEATITAKATTTSGGTGTLAIRVEVTPMRIIYGSPENLQDGRPYIVYTLNEDGTVPTFSELLGFYPVKEGSQSGTFEADTDKPKINLIPGMGADGDVEYTYIDGISGDTITTSTLPNYPTVDSEGNPHSIRVELKMKNPSYKFCTVGTNWQPEDTIVLYVSCYETGMNEVDLYLEGDDTPLKTFDDSREYEYTGEGIVPTQRDLTTLYTKGTDTDHSITKFNAHFHAVEEGTNFSGTHLAQVENKELTAEALKGIAPSELGVYSFVINGYNNDTNTYCYASRRYRIIKGNPTGNPDFEAVESGVELAAIELSGSMMNAAGKPVEGVFEWVDASQIVEQGAAYAWKFTPDDSDHYNVAEGESVVWPEAGPANDKEDLAALIKYAEDAKNAENYKYLVPKVKDLFEKALADAIAVNANEDATQKEVEEAYDELLAKVHLLDFTGNTENLTVLVATAEGKNEELYTKESWEPFAEALQVAQELLKDRNVLQAELDAAHDALQAAMDALIEKPIDTSKLEKLVAEASVYEAKLENYIPSTAESFMAALNGAREVLANSEISDSEVTQDAVDSAYKTLLNAIFGLREVPNKDKLEELLGKVETLDLSAYSEETANAVKAAVAMAETVMEDENANQKQVDAAVAALEEAVAALEVKEEVDDNEAISDEIEDDSKTDDSSVTDKKVVSNDGESKDTVNKTTTDKTDGKAAAQTGDAAKAAIPVATATAALLAVWFVWKKK